MHAATSRLASILCASLLAAHSLAFQPPAPRSRPIEAAPDQTVDHAAVFLEAWNITRLAFYDPAMHGVDWNAVRDELLPRARAASSAADTSAVINEALARLKASHTAHYTPDQREYYELLDIFWPDGIPERSGSGIRPGVVQFVGIGVVVRAIDGRFFAADVYDDGPAAHAGLKLGDELLGVEDGPWSDIAAFRNREGKPTRITIRRIAGGPTVELLITPRLIRPRELFLESMKAGARLIERDGRRIAYIRVRSYGHTDYHDLLKRLLADDFKNADALALDLRGGWGGARPDYLDIFNPIVPTLEFKDRDGQARRYDAAWRKPAAVLIDEHSRSGKEVLAYAIRKHRSATLVGTRTAGAVLAGTVRPLSDGSVLYVAVNDLTVDGDRIEGVGVEPHQHAALELPYAAGKDPQFDAAINTLVQQLRNR